MIRRLRRLGRRVGVWLERKRSPVPDAATDVDGLDELTLWARGIAERARLDEAERRQLLDGDWQ